MPAVRPPPRTFTATQPKRRLTGLLRERLADHGVVVLGATGRDDTAAQLATRGGPLALRYHLFAALLALALAVGALVLVAAVDRNPRGAELSSLRVQGLAAGTAARIARGGYTAIVVAGALLGLVAGGAAWAVSGSALPIFDDGAFWPTPKWPPLPPVAWPWLATVAVLVAVALAMGAHLRRPVHPR
jgi:hypothetical protein